MWAIHTEGLRCRSVGTSCKTTPSPILSLSIPAFVVTQFVRFVSVSHSKNAWAIPKKVCDQGDEGHQGDVGDPQ